MPPAPGPVSLRWRGAPTRGETSAVLEALTDVGSRFSVRLGPRCTVVRTVLSVMFAPFPMSHRTFRETGVSPGHTFVRAEITGEMS